MKYRELCHPEVMENSLNGSFDAAFRRLESMHPNAGQSTGHLTAALSREGLAALVPGKCNQATMFALFSWWKNERPVWTLSEDLTMALTHTDPPMDTFDMDPHACVPLSGMFVQLPPVFFIQSPDGESFPIEGLYIVEDIVRKSRDSDEVAPGILLVGVGKDKAEGAWLNRNVLGPCRDDAVLFFTVCEGTGIKQLTEPDKATELLGAKELTRLALNLLWMLQYVPDYIVRTAVADTPLKGRTPRALRRAGERLLQKGRTHRGYLLLDLPAKAQRHSWKVTTSTVRSHIVCGHIHHYWCNDPKGARPTATKQVGDKTKYLMPRWVLPYRKGKKSA